MMCQELYQLFYLCFHLQFFEIDIKPILQMRNLRPEEVKRPAYNLKATKFMVGPEVDSRSAG